MLIERGNPYSAKPPAVLHLGWDDFRFELSTTNRAALGHRAKWTVLAYLAADCNLARWMFDDLMELKSAGSSDDVHVLALFDGPLPADSFIARLNAGTTLGEDLVMRFNELRTNDPKLLTQVLMLAQAYPAERRLVILGGHGGGWRGALVDQGLGRCYLQEPGRLVLPGPGAACDAELHRCQRQAQDELNAAIERQGVTGSAPIDVLAFDACYMGNLEAIGAFGEHARWLVVSEDQWPGEGFDYRALLQKLLAHPDTDPEDLATQCVADHAQLYRYKGRGKTPVTLAAMRAPKLAPLADAFVHVAQTLDPRDSEVMGSLHEALQSCWNDQHAGFVDLKGLAQQLRARNVSKDCTMAARTLLDRFDDVVAASCGGLTPASTNGLSVYAPPPERFDADYIRLANELPYGLGIWAWTLGGYYLHRLGREAPGHPLISSLQETMKAAIAAGAWRPA